MCFCEIYRFRNLWCHDRHCYIMEVTLMLISFESYIEMKFGQILVCCITNISNMFLAQCWRLKTSSRPFYDFIKMTIQQDLANFNSCNLPVPSSPFQKIKTLESWHNWLLSNWNRLLNWIGRATLNRTWNQVL